MPHRTQPCRTRPFPLRGAVLRSAVLRDPLLGDPSLGDAELRHAALRHAQFGHAQFGHAELSHAKLRFAQPRLAVRAGAACTRADYLHSRGAQPKYREQGPYQDYPVSAVPQGYSPSYQNEYREGDNVQLDQRQNDYGQSGSRHADHRESDYRESDYREAGQRQEESQPGGYPAERYGQDSSRGADTDYTQSGYAADGPAYPDSWGSSPASAPAPPTRPEFRSGPRARFSR